MDQDREEEDQVSGSKHTTGTTSEEEYQLLSEVGCVFSDKRQEKLKTFRQGIEILVEPSTRTELERKSNKEVWGGGLKG